MSPGTMCRGVHLQLGAVAPDPALGGKSFSKASMAFSARYSCQKLKTALMRITRGMAPASSTMPAR